MSLMMNFLLTAFVLVYLSNFAQDVVVVAFSVSVSSSRIQATTCSSFKSGQLFSSSSLTKFRYLSHSTLRKQLELDFRLFSSRRPGMEDDYDENFDDEIDEEEYYGSSSRSRNGRRNDSYDGELNQRIDSRRYPPQNNAKSRKRKRQDAELSKQEKGDSDDSLYSNEKVGQEDDYYDDDEVMDDEEYSMDDDVDYDEEFLDAPNGKLTRYRNEYRRRNGKAEQDENWEVDDYNYADEMMTDDEPAPGNFWSNPTGGMDQVPPGMWERDLSRPPGRVRVRPSRKRQPPDWDYDAYEDYYVNRNRGVARRGPKWRSPVRASQPGAPKLVREFYDWLFWSGLGIADNGDNNNSVYRGTRGRFNALAYYESAKDAMAKSKAKRKPRKRNANRLPPQRYDDRQETEYYDDTDSDRSYPPESVRNRYNRRIERSRTAAKPRRPWYDGYDDFRYENENLEEDLSEEVSSWFTDDDEQRNDDELDVRRERSIDKGSARRRRQGRSSEWSPRNMLDSFLGWDRDMAYKAAEYDVKMGVRRNRPTQSIQRQSSRRSPRDYPSRPGYAYRYDANQEEEDSPTVLDIDATVEINDEQNGSNRREQDPEDNSIEQTRNGKRELSWEERQAAVERVPPADVVAWGPKGQLPMNARQKAIEDALQDIQAAKRKLDERIKTEIKARDEVAILNVDAKAQRLKIEGSRRGASSVDFERLRQTELEINAASLALRRAKTRVDLAREEMEELQERHYAVLSFYNPDQASMLIGEALNEFSDEVNPPANGVAKPDESTSIDNGKNE